MLMRWSVAFGHAMLCHVRADAVLEKELGGVLTPEVRGAARAAPR